MEKSIKDLNTLLLSIIPFVWTWNIFIYLNNIQKVNYVSAWTFIIIVSILIPILHWVDLSSKNEHKFIYRLIIILFILLLFASIIFISLDIFLIIYKIQV